MEGAHKCTAKRSKICSKVKNVLFDSEALVLDVIRHIFSSNITVTRYPTGPIESWWWWYGGSGVAGVNGGSSASKGTKTHSAIFATYQSMTTVWSLMPTNNSDMPLNGFSWTSMLLKKDIWLFMDVWSMSGTVSNGAGGNACDNKKFEKEPKFHLQKFLILSLSFFISLQIVLW